MKTLSICHAVIGCLVFLSCCKNVDAAEKLLLWNKLGSVDEVQHSAVGPSGEIIGNVLFKQGKYGNGFRSAQRTGDKNIPTNFVRLPLSGLRGQGCIEFWLHPDWQDGSVGHVIDLLNYGVPETQDSSSVLVFTSGYNNWTNTINTCVYDKGNSSNYVCDYVYLSGNAQWSTSQPIHIAYTWDSAAEKKLTIYLNGQSAGSDYRTNGVLGNSSWSFIGTPYLYVGSRPYSGDWDRHNWEPNVDGVIDNIKVWNYAKRDFSDRYYEGPTGLLLWNKLGSTDEIEHSAVGPNGETVGNVLFEKGRHGNGFRSAQRTSDKDTPNNFVRFPLTGLSPQGKGCIEFWYHPNWSNSNVGHVVDLFNYGIPEVVGTTPVKLVLSSSYNDWQERIQGWVRDDDPETATAISYIYQSGHPQWSTVQPVHFAFTWDASAEKKVAFYLNGQLADSGYEHLYADPDAFLWNFIETPYLYLGSRMYSGDWNRHNWEPNVDGVIDNIKVWDYAKTDFSDRFTEGLFATDRADLQMIYQLLLRKR